jgi:hypothetical protein
VAITSERIGGGGSTPLTKYHLPALSGGTLFVVGCLKSMLQLVRRFNSVRVNTHGTQKLNQILRQYLICLCRWMGHEVRLKKLRICLCRWMGHEVRVKKTKKLFMPMDGA